MGIKCQRDIWCLLIISLVRAYMCVCMYACVCVCVCVSCTCMHVCSCMHVCMHVRMCVHVRMCAHMRLRAYMFVRVCCIYICACMWRIILQLTISYFMGNFRKHLSKFTLLEQIYQEKILLYAFRLTIKIEKRLCPLSVVGSCMDADKLTRKELLLISKAQCLLILEKLMKTWNLGLRICRTQYPCANWCINMKHL